MPAPLANLVTATGTSTHDVDDIMIGTKIRLMPETASRPSFGFRFATRLPNAKNESGLGQDTTDFYASLLGAKTVQSMRVVGNLGFAIMSEPIDGTKPERRFDVRAVGRAGDDAADRAGRGGERPHLDTQRQCRSAPRAAAL